MKTTFFARAPPPNPKTESSHTKNKQKKKGDSQNFFAMYISQRFPTWVFSPFSPEMYKTISREGV